MVTYNCAPSHTGDTANNPPCHGFMQILNTTQHPTLEQWLSNTLPIIAIAKKDTVADGLCMSANLNKSNRNVVWYLVFLSLHIPYRAAIQKVYSI